MIARRPIVPKRQKPMTQKERDFRFTMITRIGCIACRLQYSVHSEPVIHHLIGLDSTRKGNGGKADDRETIPLCPRHHQHYGIGTSLHDGVETWEEIHGTQQELLIITNNILGSLQ